MEDLTEPINQFIDGEISADDLARRLGEAGDELPDTPSTVAEMYDRAEDRDIFAGAWGQVELAYYGSELHRSNRAPGLKKMDREKYFEVTQAVDDRYRKKDQSPPQPEV